MTRRLILASTLAVLVASPAVAQQVHGSGALPRVSYAPDGMSSYAALPPDADDEDRGTNAFFYPQGYDPQYGSEGRLPDAADFAADYGCAPVWNARLNHDVPACN